MVGLGLGLLYFSARQLIMRTAVAMVQDTMLIVMVIGRLKERLQLYHDLHPCLNMLCLWARCDSAPPYMKVQATLSCLD